MKNILVTGGNGQLGNELKKLSKNYGRFSFVFTDVEELDITKSKEVSDFFKSNKFDYVINCASYTAVDKAESEPELARKINAEAVKILAEACNRHGCAMIHISTDFVFNGKNYKPYVESDKPDPLSVYADSKFTGEELFLDNIDNGMIIRTSWLYSEFGANFVKTIMKHAKDKDSLNVVFDQTGTPTHAFDLADAIMKIISSGSKIRGRDIYHYSNEGVASWYDFAVAVVELAGIQCDIKPIEAKDFPLPAERPHYSVMNKAKVKKDFGLVIPYWRISLNECIKRIVEL